LLGLIYHLFVTDFCSSDQHQDWAAAGSVAAGAWQLLHRLAIIYVPLA
jgi:hypothetical protein